MFPDRIGKLVIDGVINTKDYFYDNWYVYPFGQNSCPILTSILGNSNP